MHPSSTHAHNGSPLNRAWPALTRAASTAPAVKTILTPNRPRRPIENDEYGAFIRRVLRAYGRRIAAGDIDAITDLAATAEQVDDAIRHAVTGLRAHGYSWADIAARLGVTRQAAQQRWGGDRP